MRHFKLSEKKIELALWENKLELSLDFYPKYRQNSRQIKEFKCLKNEEIPFKHVRKSKSQKVKTNRDFWWRSG